MLTESVFVGIAGETIYLRLSTGRDVTVTAEHLLRIPPQKKDKVKVLSGDQKGATGVLIGIDGADAIVKLDQTFVIKILEMDALAKWVPSS